MNFNVTFGGTKSEMHNSKYKMAPVSFGDASVHVYFRVYTSGLSDVRICCKEKLICETWQDIMNVFKIKEKMVVYQRRKKNILILLCTVR